MERKPASGNPKKSAAEERADLRAWRRAREEVRRKGTIPWKRLRKELALDSSDVNGDPKCGITELRQSGHPLVRDVHQLRLVAS
jgi:hypothetical protein